MTRGSTFYHTRWHMKGDSVHLDSTTIPNYPCYTPIRARLSGCSTIPHEQLKSMRGLDNSVLSSLVCIRLACYI